MFDAYILIIVYN